MSVEVTYLLHGAEGPADTGVLDTVPASAQRPSEVLVVAPGARRRWWRRAAGTPVGSVAAGVAAARGELLWLVDARATVDREVWARCLRRLDDADVAWARASLATPEGEARSPRSLLAVDLDAGAPVVGLVRRELLGAPADDAALLAAWARVLHEREGRTVRTHPVATDHRRAPGPLAPMAGLVAAAAGEPPVPPPTPTVGWIGFAGNHNLGDEAVLRAAEELLPGVELLQGGEGTHGTVLGGGTLLNADRFYQRLADEVDDPALPHLVLGTGVVSPTVKGFSEELGPWRAFLEAGPTGLRGPDSVEHLRRWGWAGPTAVLGDPALALEPVASPGAGVGPVVVAPVASSPVGQVTDADEAAQVALLAAAVRRWRADDREVVLLACHPDDARACRAVADGADAALDVVAGHEHLDGALALLAGASLVVGTRLHAIVLAAAAGTPFVGLAYRPKLLDFARSVDAEQVVRPIDGWDEEQLLAAEAWWDGTHRALVAAAVAGHRAALRSRAAAFLDRVRALDR